MSLSNRILSLARARVLRRIYGPKGKCWQPVRGKPRARVRVFVDHDPDYMSTGKPRARVRVLHGIGKTLAIPSFIRASFALRSWFICCSSVVRFAFGSIDGEGRNGICVSERAA